MVRALLRSVPWLVLLSCGPAADPCCDLSSPAGSPFIFAPRVVGESATELVPLLAEDPQVVGALRLTDDVAGRFEVHAVAGASLGAGEAWNVPVRFLGHTEPGAYHAVLVVESAAPGRADVADIFHLPLRVVVSRAEAGADADGDGLSDRIELEHGGVPTDADTDDDGLVDGEDGLSDRDGDGAPALLDPDSDGDAVVDGTEAGIQTAGPSTDLGRGVFVPDADPSTRTDPGAADTDGDGLVDGREDLDRDGAVGPEELDPLALDSDGDGLTDDLEGPDFPAPSCPSPLDADTDDDGLLDGAADEPAPCDFDLDGDGLGDGLELGVPAGVAGTQSPPFRPDLDVGSRTFPAVADSDGGGAADGAEDADGNGRRDPGERDPLDPSDDGATDSDLDLVPDAGELAAGSDPADTDSDDDGLQDGADGLSDTDGDGRIDALDPDSDDDRLLDGTESGLTAPGPGTLVAAGAFVADTDPSTLTNSDLADSDGDGLADGVEDADHRGSRDGDEADPALIDTDADGLTDPEEDLDRDGRWDADESSPARADTDADGSDDGAERAAGTDPLSPDTDADGLLDGGEGAASGAPPWTDPLQPDTDGDGLFDGLELGSGPPGRPDLDPSTTTAPWSADSDGGGSPDGEEDSNRNGRFDLGERDPLDPADDARIDADGDGFLAAIHGGSDCLDSDASRHPGAAESCDAMDSDCDGSLLDGAPDLDGDLVPDCAEEDVDGDGSGNGADCAPLVPSVHPGAPESCDSLDSDCDGSLVDSFADFDGDTQPDCIDADDDGDGVGDALDCGPLDPGAGPGSAEFCDSVDQDCDGDFVDGFANTDGDGLPDCVDPDDDEDGAPDALDCGPADAARFPGAVDVAMDGIDQDCSGADTRLCHPDVDGDGHGTAEWMENPLGTCTIMPWSLFGDDCDDDDAGRSPGIPERCNGRDDDCDAATHAARGELDPDLDGYLPCPAFAFTDDGVIAASGGPYLGGGDCLEGGPAGPWVHPGQDERCDGWDTDCTEPLSAGVPAEGDEWDADGDGHLGCAALDAVPIREGIVGAGDCDEDDGERFPGALEACDAIDSNCDGTLVDLFSNLDGDGEPDCVDADIDGDLWLAVNECDDWSATTFPGAPELVGDGVDQDCDGTDTVLCHLDGDLDGFGGSGTMLDADGACEDSGQAPLGDDCDDGTFHRAPNLEEVCDGLDNDCDPATDLPEIDLDLDTFLLCTGYIGRGANNAAGEPISGGGDCDDDDDSYHPGAPESCDLADTDCDLDVVDGYPNFDGDSEADCTDLNDDNDPIVDGADCDDFDADIYPSAPESCDLVDSDCDGDFRDEFPDFDADGEANCTDPNDDGDPSGDLLDCNDNDATVFPGAPEFCDLVDGDCDGEFIDGFDNADFDNLPDCSDWDDDNDLSFDTVDCAPFDPTRYPTAPETCDLIDSDCDGSLVDTFLNTDGDLQPDCVDSDDDGDGTADTLDCGPLDPTRYPGAYESCDAIDSDCDSSLVDGYANFDADSDPDCVDTNDDNDPSLDSADCDDFNAATYPGAAEACDSIDSDCDLSLVDGFANYDGDASPDCVDLNDDNDPYNDAGDCAPLNAAIHPGAAEVCNTVDDNCNGVRDDGSICGGGCYRYDFGGHVYQFCFGYDNTWYGAANHCTNSGYYLTMLETNAEHVAVVQYAYAIDPYSAWWFGAHDINVEGYYQWISGAPMSYQYWLPGEPNNYGNYEDCVNLLRFALAPHYAPYHMVDDYCGYPYNFVCESW